MAAEIRIQPSHHSVLLVHLHHQPMGGLSEADVKRRWSNNQPIWEVWSSVCALAMQNMTVVPRLSWIYLNLLLSTLANLSHTSTQT